MSWRMNNVNSSVVNSVEYCSILAFNLWNLVLVATVVVLT